MYYSTQKIYAGNSRRDVSAPSVRNFGLIMTLCMALAALISL